MLFTQGHKINNTSVNCLVDIESIGHSLNEFPLLFARFFEGYNEFEQSNEHEILLLLRELFVDACANAKHLDRIEGEPFF